MGSLHLRAGKSKGKKPRLIFYMVSVKVGEKKYQNINLSTGISVLPSQWSKPKRRVLSAQHPNAEAVNQALDDFCERVDRIVLEGKQRGHRITAEYIRFLLSTESAPKVIGPNLKTAFQEYAQEQRDQRTKASETIAKGCLTKLLDFEKAKGYPIEFDTLDKAFFPRFTRYLKVEQELAENTIHRHVKALRAFMRWAEDKHYHENQYWRSFSYKAKSFTSFFALTASELTALRELDLSSELRLAKVRDLFLFMCDTGMRHGDAVALKPENIRKTKDPNTGELAYLLSYHSKKTGTNVRARLADEPRHHRYPLTLALTYIEQKRGDGLVFPRISNQKMNNYLKELAHLAHLDRIVSTPPRKGVDRDQQTPIYDVLASHCARRTFVTLRKQQGWSDDRIAAYTGHLSRELNGYIKTTDQYFLSLTTDALDLDA